MNPEKTAAQRETALIIETVSKETKKNEAKELEKELKALLSTLDIDTVDSVIVKLDKPHPRYYLGTGKTEEIASLAEDYEADVIVFDADLSPAQQRNIQEHTKRTVITRAEVILDIFATRATTREAMLQVELAKLQYALPRLKRAWTHLSRQRGGAKGTRGEGEKQIEVDKRIIQDNIAKVKSELEEVKRHRKTMRKRRESVPMITAAIVGYTNAGKSSLLNLLTDANVDAENKLFATLDPTTRKVSLEGGQELLLTDTVGFIRRLPHDLIEAFHSTLEEAALADFLIILVDASSHEAKDHFDTTMQVLRELGGADKPFILALNKSDKLIPGDQDPTLHLFPEALKISAKTGKGIDELKTAIRHKLQQFTVIEKYRIPQSRYDVVAWLHRNANVLKEEYEDGVVLVKTRIPSSLKGKISQFSVT